MGVDGINVMAENFVSSEFRESKYSKARQAAAEARGQMVNRQNSVLLSGMAACNAADPDGTRLSRRILEGQKAGRRMQLEMRRNVTETSQENLDELKKRLEEKAEDALKRASGQETSPDVPVEEQARPAVAATDAAIRGPREADKAGARPEPEPLGGDAADMPPVAAAVAVASPAEAPAAGAVAGALDLVV